MKAVLLGATQGMGRALARAMVERGDEVFLLGRNAEALARSASDLQVRAARRAPLGSAICDLENPAGFVSALDAANDALGKIDAIIVTAGAFANQEALEADVSLVEKVLRVDFTNTVAFCELARKRLLDQGGGTLCVFSSVAGERGRKPVVIYGAAKAGLSAYLEGLDHKFRDQGLKTVCIKPGFVKTGMTQGLKPPPFAAEPEQVARLALRAIDRGTPVTYAPQIWALIMLVIRWLPRGVMRRIGF